jgi:hypothetical protein
MSPSLTSALSEVPKKSEFPKSPLASGPSNERPLHATVRNLITRARLWLGKVVSSAFARYLIAFFIGVTATLAWQSYGGAARKAIAGWSPHLGWLAPAAAPADTSRERLKATSLALVAARQSLDKLATEISKLQAQSTADKPSRSGSSRTPPVR